MRPNLHAISAAEPQAWLFAPTGAPIHAKEAAATAVRQLARWAGTGHSMLAQTTLTARALTRPMAATTAVSVLSTGAAGARPATIEEEIASWAATRPAWQQAVLRQLAQGHRFSGAEIEAIARGLAAGKQTQAAKLKPADIPGAQTAGARVVLDSIREPVNVNALADSQRLGLPRPVSPWSTATTRAASRDMRVIKAGAAARHRKPVHENVFALARGAQ